MSHTVVNTYADLTVFVVLLCFLPDFLILLKQAKRKRAEYLKQRGSPRSSAHADYIKHADFLSRKLARYYRHTTHSLI
jgi:hypothetical protein